MDKNIKKSRLVQRLRWLLIAQLSALVTVTTFALADAQFAFKDSDDADTRIDMSVNIILNLDRKIAVSEMSKGHIQLKRSTNGVAKEVKGYCVRANYDGLAGLRITSKNKGDDSIFALQNANQDTVPMTVMIEDALAGGAAVEVQPNQDLTIGTLQADLCDKATTNLEVSVDFDKVEAKSGLFETTLSLIFVAK